MPVSKLWSIIRHKLLQTWGADQVSDMSVSLIEQTINRMQHSAAPDELLELAVAVLAEDWPEYEMDDPRRAPEFWRSFIRDLLAES